MEQIKRGRWPLIIVGILIVVIVFLVVWEKTNTSKDDIKVAYISTLSGDTDVWGQSLKKGFDFALNEINASGGIKGRKVTAVYEDDKCNASSGLTVFNKVIDVDGVKYITGTVCSTVAMAVAKKTQDNRVFYVASAATSPEVPKQGDLIFRPWPSDANDALVVGKEVVTTFGLKKLAVISMDDNPAGIALRNTFKDTVIANGGQIISDETINSKTKDVKTSIQKILTGNPEGIYVATLPEQSILVIGQIKSLGYKGKIFVYGDSALSGGFADKIKDKTDIFYASPLSVKETSFWSDYKAETGTEPDLLVALGYDSMKMIAYGIDVCGEDNDCIRDTFLNIKDYQMTRGKVSFDQYGDVNGFEYEIVSL
jgi:branched-chain amino acid transport system substrate-binding protein